VTFGDMMFIPSFMKTGQLMCILLTSVTEPGEDDDSVPEKELRSTGTLKAKE